MKHKIDPVKPTQKSHDSCELSDSELLRKLQEKYFGKPPATQTVFTSSSPTPEDDDTDQGDVYWCSGIDD
jgi:hypothetical protein